MTPAQCRAARALLDWSQQQLADAAKVGNATIRNFESGKSAPQHATLDVLRRTLEAAGVIFVAENGDGPGVKLRKGGVNVIGMPAAAGPSHDGQIEGIRNRLAKEDATETPAGGMEALQRGRAENTRRKAAVEKTAGKISASAVIAKGAEARGKAKTAVDEALADLSASGTVKANRKRKLTSMPDELKPRRK